MIHFKTDSVPKLGGELPFVYKARRLSLKKPSGIDLRHGKILPHGFRIVHIKKTLCCLLCSRRLATPLRSFDKYGSLSLQFSL